MRHETAEIMNALQREHIRVVQTLHRLETGTRVVAAIPVCEKH